MKNSVFLLVILLLALSININSQWVQVNNGMGNVSVNSFAYSGNNIFAATGNYGASTYGVFLSTNNGTNWSQTSLNNRFVYSLAINGNYIFAGTAGLPEPYGIYLSINNGTSWVQTSLNNQWVYSLAVNGNNIFAGTSNGVYKSTNNGTSWTQTTLNNRIVFSLAVNGNNIFTGTGDYGVYKSTNNGTSWTQTSLNSQTVRSLTANGNNIFAGIGPSSSGVYLSTNSGTSWTQSSLNNRIIWALASNGNNIFAGTGNLYGVYISTNNGTNWIQRNEGLGNLSVLAFCILNNYIFAGTSLNCVYRRPLGELVGINPVSSEIPSEFSLEQNYPNPFNPTTKIQFQIPKSGFVNMVIYDILGREIATLVNEELSPGTYEVDWDVANYPSGVYYYQLVVGDNTNNGGFTETKKMVLVK